MSDLPRNEGEWIVPPQDYLQRRPPTHSASRTPQSIHVAMRDGVRLALDVYRPLDADGPTGRPVDATVPAITIFTPYYRRFTLAPKAPPSSEPSTSAFRYRGFFVARAH